MDVSWFTLLVMAAVIMATVLLGLVCLDCGKKAPASISQTDASEEYVSSGFHVIHPCQARPDSNTLPSPSNVLPHPNLDPRSDPRLRPNTPTETESNPSYENQDQGKEFPESDGEDNGYIKVLPETEPSRASSPGSDCEYVNVSNPKSDVDSDSDTEQNYVNVEMPQRCELPRPVRVMRAGSEPDLGSSQSEEDDDEYVNQPLVAVGTQL